MPSNTRLKGYTDVGQSTFSDQIESNLITFFNWGMLNIGGFGNVTMALASGAYGGDMSRMRPVNDPNYPSPDGQSTQIWEGFRQDWVWESGIEYPIQPIQISGVYVNGGFVPVNSTGVYTHSINYPLGRVTFQNPLPTGTVVQTEYSYRLFTFQSSDETWFRQVMFESFRVDNPDFLSYGSGVWNVLAQERVQLPAVVVDVVPRRRMFGYELGGTTTVHQDVLFHIFTENPYDRKRMMDYITFQKDKTIPLFDKNLMAQANAFPLDQNGQVASGAKCFPDLVQPTGQGGFYWKYGTFLEMTTQESVSRPPLYQAVARSTFEVNLLIL